MANNLDFLARLSLSEFMTGTRKAQAEYTSTKRGIEGKPIQFSGAGVDKLLGQLAAITASFLAVQKISSAVIESQANFANVATLGVQNIGELVDGVSSIGADVPQQLRNIETGLYDVVSAGVDAANQIEVLNQSSRGAVAGLSSVAEALSLGAAVVKGTTNDFNDFGQALDFAFKTVELGQTTFGELANNIGEVAPFANTLNLELAELFGTYATLTGVTGNTAKVTTQVKAIFNSVLKPTKDLEKATSDYGSASAAISKLGLVGFLELLREKTGGSAEAFGELFESSEALLGVLALSGPQFDTFQEKIDLLRESSGATNKAFEIQAQTLQAQLVLLSNNADILVQSLARGVVPAISEVLAAAVDFLKFFNGLSEGAQRALLAINGFSAALVLLPPIIRTLQSAILLLNASMGPAGWLILGLTAAASAAVIFADGLDAANLAQQKLAKTVEGFNEDLREQLRRGYDDRNLGELIERQVFYSQKLRESIDRLELLKERIAASDRETGGFRQVIIEAEEQIKAYQTAIDELDKLIVKRREFEDSITNKPQQDIDFAELDKVRAFQFESNRLALADYIEYLESRQEALKNSLGAESIEFLKYVDSLEVLRDRLRAQEIDPQVIIPVPSSSDLAIGIDSIRSFVDEALGLERLFSQTKLDLLAGEFLYRQSLINNTLDLVKSTVGEEALIYEQLQLKKLSIEQAYQEQRRALQIESFNSAISLGAQLMQAFAGQSRALFNIGKAAAIADASINAYKGASKTLSQYPMPLAAILAAVHVALGFAEVAKIRAVKFNAGAFARGGRIGPSDIFHLGRTPLGESGAIYAQVGETVVNRRASALFADQLEFMNKVGRGQASNKGPAQYQTGGVITSDAANDAQAVKLMNQFTKQITEQIAKIQIVINTELDALQFHRETLPVYEKDKESRELG